MTLCAMPLLVAALLPGSGAAFGVATNASFARIRSASSDFDRKAGVVLYEGNVFVEYGRDYTLNADRVFAFLAASNRLSRIVADGHVVISNGARVGTCALAP